MQQLPEPPPSVDPFEENVRPIRTVLSLACAAAMGCSLPLWQSSRAFPSIPISPDWPVLPQAVEIGLLGLMPLALFFGVQLPRIFLSLFLALSAFHVFSDQCRLQPWLYQYWVMLLMTLFPARAAMGGCRVVMSAVYFWAGAQKCNTDFFETVVPWFIEPASHWIPAAVLPAVRILISAAPQVELFIALGVWFRPLRKLALLVCLAMHIVALVFLGPLGHQANLVVWPWNLAMPILMTSLFPERVPISALDGLKQTPAALSIVAAFCFLPALSFLGQWDSYLSFALYSGNVSRAEIFFTEAGRKRLPQHLRPYVVNTATQYDPDLQGPYVFDFHRFAFDTIKVPEPPEPRIFRAIARDLVRHLEDPNDLRLIIQPRHGPAVAYRGGELK